MVFWCECINVIASNFKFAKGDVFCVWLFSGLNENFCAKFGLPLLLLLYINLLGH
jgi:hypothetical protein